MRIRLAIGENEVAFEVPDDRVAGTWGGPPGQPGAEVAAATREALRAPLDFPPLSLAVVEGDRVVIPFDLDVPAEVLGALVEELGAASVPPIAITVLTASPAPAGLRDAVPFPLKWKAHDPDDADGLSYLASTAAGRRIYLDRLLVDADVAFPVGRLGPRGDSDRRGPWNAIFPGLSDRASLADPTAGRDEEGIEVSWLLGSQLQVGVIPGDVGVHRVLAGTAEGLHRFAGEQDALWTYRADRKSDLVIATVASGEGGPSLADLGDALTAASRLVSPGGRIALLSEVRGEFGPALRQLVRAGREGTDPLRALKGQEGAEDYAAARALVRARSVASVYLLADLETDDLEELMITALEGADQAEKLIGQARACHFVNRINWARIRLGEVSR